MKKLLITISVLVVMIAGATVAFAAAAPKTPAEIVSDLTGKSVEKATEARQSGQTYGNQAAEANKLVEFKDARLAQFKLALDEAVKEKRMTQTEADARYQSMESRTENCTGNGSGQGAANGRGLGSNSRGLGKGYGGMGRNCTLND
jgi:hypothetical protein